MEKSKVGRKKLNIDHKLLKSEIEKYLNGQSGVKTYQNLKIGKTSFYKILTEMGVKK